MTTYKQVVAFNLKKMGTQKGYCEKNVRLGYGLPARCASAKDDMEYNKSKGALHPMSTLPKNVTVPVFVDTSSPYEHVEVCDHGTYYSDGKKVANPSKQKFFGWGEFCAKARVVEPVKTPAPAPKPAAIKVGDTVLVTGQGTGNAYGGGGKTRYYRNQKMRVIRITNNHYGCNQYNQDGGITGWWTASQVRKA